MNTIERHQAIINKIKKEGQVKVLTLCDELKVSSVTIRKDLKFLEDKGLLFRAHGGATLHNPYTVDRPVNEKEKLHLSEKNENWRSGGGRLSRTRWPRRGNCARTAWPA